MSHKNTMHNCLRLRDEDLLYVISIKNLNHRSSNFEVGDKCESNF